MVPLRPPTFRLPLLAQGKAHAFRRWLLLLLPSHVFSSVPLSLVQLHWNHLWMVPEHTRGATLPRPIDFMPFLFGTIEHKATPDLYNMSGPNFLPSSLLLAFSSFVKKDVTSGILYS